MLKIWKIGTSSSTSSLKELLSELARSRYENARQTYFCLDRKRVSHYRSPLCASPSHLLTTFSWTDEEHLARMRCWWDELGRGGGGGGGGLVSSMGQQQYGPCRAVGQLSGTYGGCQGWEGSGSRWRVVSLLNGHHFNISQRVQWADLVFTIHACNGY